MIDQVFRMHGLPVDVVSNRGPQFVSKFWKDFCQQIWATTSLSSDFHPQTNGQSEWANQDLEQALRRLRSQNPSYWSQQLSWIEYAHNWVSTSFVPLTGARCHCSVCLSLRPLVLSHLEKG